MFQGKKYIIIVVSIMVLIGIIVTVYILKKNDPLEIVEETLKIKLSDSVKVQNFTYYNEGDYYEVKILLTEESLSDMENQLNRVFSGKKASKQDIKDMPNFGSTCPWWDLDEKSIITAYHTFVSSEIKWFKSSPDAHGVWAFITKGKDGKHYLYISY